MNSTKDNNAPLCRTILITDDDKDVRWALSSILKQEGFVILEAECGATALKILKQGMVDIMLLDVRMADMNGIEVLRSARKAGYDTPIIFLSGFGTVELASEAGRLGASGFLTKPFKKEDLVLTLQMVLMGYDCVGKKKKGNWLPTDRKELGKVLGPSPQSQKIYGMVAKVAPTDYTVVISGETGVGKELVAHMIHQMSARREGPFVALDCGSITPTLIEAELFGHEKGAFTGATSSRPGFFEIANGGTLLLDEIGNLPLAMQAKLLRVLQERQVCRVGSSIPIKVDVRVLAATNENLVASVEAGRFRSDLYYRLNEFSIPVAPLRERGADTLFLARKFAEEAYKELNKPDCAISETIEEILVQYRFPGNVRELRNIIRRAVLIADATIQPEHLNIDMTKLSLNHLVAQLGSGENERAELTFREIVHQKIAQTERDILIKVLAKTGGNMAEAARILQIDYKTMRTKAKDYQLSFNLTIGRPS